MWDDRSTFQEHGSCEPLNILVTSPHDDEDGWIFKITDFGAAHSLINSSYLATTASSQTHNPTGVGTLPYEAPEIVLMGAKKLSFASDVYSFSMVMWELLHPEQPYPWFGEFQGNAQFIRDAVQHGRRPKITNEHFSKSYIKLMLMCWEQSMEKRPTFQMVHCSFC